MKKIECWLPVAVSVRHTINAPSNWESMCESEKRKFFLANRKNVPLCDHCKLHHKETEEISFEYPIEWGFIGVEV